MTISFKSLQEITSLRPLSLSLSLSEQKRLIRNFCPLFALSGVARGKFLICYSIFGFVRHACATKFT